MHDVVGALLEETTGKRDLTKVGKAVALLLVAATVVN